MRSPDDAELAEHSQTRGRINVNDADSEIPLLQDSVILIGLGANLPSDFGPPQTTLEKALEILEAGGVRIVKRSNWRITPPWPPGAAQPDYVNGAALVETALDPEALLRACMEAEARLGRRRLEIWGPRVCDLDLLAYGRVVLPGAEAWALIAAAATPPPDQPALVLPHPRLHRRIFALEPAAEIAPDWRHPVLGLSLAELAARRAAEDRPPSPSAVRKTP